MTATEKKWIAISGASGFVGQALCHALLQKGYGVYALGRDKTKLEKCFPGEVYPDLQPHDYSELASLRPHAVVNLAGENIAQRRWSLAQKQRLLDSRVQTTRQLVSAARRDWPTLSCFISASAIGVYGYWTKTVRLAMASPPSFADTGKPASIICLVEPSSPALVWYWTETENREHSPRCGPLSHWDSVPALAVDSSGKPIFTGGTWSKHCVFLSIARNVAVYTILSAQSRSEIRNSASSSPAPCIDRFFYKCLKPLPPCYSAKCRSCSSAPSGWCQPHWRRQATHFSSVAWRPSSTTAWNVPSNRRDRMDNVSQ